MRLDVFSVTLLTAAGQDLEPERVQLDEARGILVVVGLGALEAGDGVVVQAVLAAAAGDVACALEELDAGCRCERTWQQLDE